MENKEIKNNREIIFPEESSLIIEKILGKYGLMEVENKKSGDLETSVEDDFFETIESLPSVKVAGLVKDCAINKISIESLPSQIEITLGVTKKNAEEIAKKLKEKIIDYAKPLDKDEEELPPRRIPSQEIESQTIVPNTLTEKQKTPPEKDTYRETIE